MARATWLLWPPSAQPDERTSQAIYSLKLWSISPPEPHRYLPNCVANQSRRSGPMAVLQYVKHYPSKRIAATQLIGCNAQKWFMDPVCHSMHRWLLFLKRIRSPLCTMMQHAGQWCTTQVNGARCNSVLLQWCTMYIPQIQTDRPFLLIWPLT